MMLLRSDEMRFWGGTCREVWRWELEIDDALPHAMRLRTSSTTRRPAMHAKKTICTTKIKVNK